MHMQEKRRESERQRWEREVREVREGGGGRDSFIFSYLFPSQQCSLAETL